MVMLDKERIRTLSNQDLEDLLPILRVAEPLLYSEVRVELGLRKARIYYEGYGGA